VGDWKAVYLENRASLQVWREPFVHLRMPLLFNLRRDPFEKSSTTRTPTRLDDRPGLRARADAGIASSFLLTMKDYPPSQTPGDWSLDTLEKQIKGMTTTIPVPLATAAPFNLRNLRTRGRTMKYLTVVRAAVGSSVVLFALSAFAADPLPSWNDTAPKQAIIEFVDKVTRQGSPDFVPPGRTHRRIRQRRHAVGEQPMYVQLAFALDRVKALAPAAPGVEGAGALRLGRSGRLRALAGGRARLLEIVMATTHAGMTTRNSRRSSATGSRRRGTPLTGRPYTEMVYQPMRELLAYLRANGFRTFIVSGGGVEFLRPWTERVYGMPPEQVIGSSIRTKYEVRDGCR
jgi:hypothetical protein